MITLVMSEMALAANAPKEDKKEQTTPAPTTEHAKKEKSEEPTTPETEQK